MRLMYVFDPRGGPGMSYEALRSVLDIPDMDPHAFATAYVNHVERTGNRPDVAVAAHNFARFGTVD